MPARGAGTHREHGYGEFVFQVNHFALPAGPNVRAKRATAAGRQARAGENVQSTTGPGLVACRWCSA